MDGKQGFDSSTSVWQQTGWSEVDNLRKKLENLRELRDLVRQLGRAGGKGPLRMAPQEVTFMGLTFNTCLFLFSPTQVLMLGLLNCYMVKSASALKSWDRGGMFLIDPPTVSVVHL